MVNKIVFFVFTTLFIACNREISKEDSFFFSFHNLNKQVEFPNVVDSLFHFISIDSVNIDKYKEVDDHRKIDNKYAAVFDSLDAECYRMDSLPMRRLASNIFPVGKIKLRDNIIGYIILHADYYSKSIVFYCVKNMKFTSVVPLSLSYHDKGLQGSTYFDNTSNTFLIVKDPNYGLIDSSFPYDEDFFSEIGLLKPKKVMYLYTSFRVDNKGELVIVKSVKDKLPKYLK